mmetsp:Transcript_7806/g.13806  ORF Transcript_7806/g.13806 Transcript_7806/m.13806 type:complete len:280 (+) Transcript_7806:124-963(+)
MASFARIARKVAGAVGIVGGLGLAGSMGTTYVFGSSDELSAQHLHWPHSGILDSYDHAAIRRGYQVYKNVCSSCHSMERIAYRNLVDVCYTEAEVKAIAEETDVEDGPNDQGEMFTRPGKLSDYFPSPYPNENAARYANNGALPPDLSCIIKARHNGDNYVFSLLTGYREPPAGVNPREGLHYNPYFPGGLIGMARPLYDGAVDYEDGTEATTSQMARDVVTFLSWASEPEHDERKRWGAEFLSGLVLLLAFSVYHKRFRWALFKNRRIEFKDMGPVQH